MPKHTILMFAERVLMPKNAILKHEDSILKHEDSILKHEDSILKHEDSILKHEDSILKHEDFDFNLRFSTFTPKKSISRPRTSTFNITKDKNFGNVPHIISLLRSFSIMRD